MARSCFLLWSIRSVCDVADGCEVIARKAFADDVELKSANLPDSLVQIGASAFTGSGLIRLEVPESVRSIGSQGVLAVR